MVTQDNVGKHRLVCHISEVLEILTVSWNFKGCVSHSLIDVFKKQLILEYESLVSYGALIPQMCSTGSAKLCSFSKNNCGLNAVLYES
jgi:hypothetical protein